MVDGLGAKANTTYNEETARAVSRGYTLYVCVTQPDMYIYLCRSPKIQHVTRRETWCVAPATAMSKCSRFCASITMYVDTSLGLPICMYIHE